MFKPTLPLFRDLRRLKLTTKMVGGGYYKGNRVGSMGHFVKKALGRVYNRRGHRIPFQHDYGRFATYYKIDEKKKRNYVVPDLVEFKLTPFVSKQIKKPERNPDYARTNPMSGALYLEKWKNENGDR